MSFNGKAKYIDMTLGDSTSEEDVEEVEGEEQGPIANDDDSEADEIIYLSDSDEHELFKDPPPTAVRTTSLSQHVLQGLVKDPDERISTEVPPAVNVDMETEGEKEDVTAHREVTTAEETPSPRGEEEEGAVGVAGASGTGHLEREGDGDVEMEEKSQEAATGKAAFNDSQGKPQDHPPPVVQTLSQDRNKGSDGYRSRSSSSSSSDSSSSSSSGDSTSSEDDKDGATNDVAMDNVDGSTKSAPLDIDKQVDRAGDSEEHVPKRQRIASNPTASESRSRSDSFSGFFDEPSGMSGAFAMLNKGFSGVNGSETPSTDSPAVHQAKPQRRGSITKTADVSGRAPETTGRKSSVVDEEDHNTTIPTRRTIIAMPLLSKSNAMRIVDAEWLLKAVLQAPFSTTFSEIVRVDIDEAAKSSDWKAVNAETGKVVSDGVFRRLLDSYSEDDHDLILPPRLKRLPLNWFSLKEYVEAMSRFVLCEARAMVVEGLRSTERALNLPQHVRLVSAPASRTSAPDPNQLFRKVRKVSGGDASGDDHEGRRSQSEFDDDSAAATVVAVGAGLSIEEAIRETPGRITISCSAMNEPRNIPKDFKMRQTLKSTAPNGCSFQAFSHQFKQNDVVLLLAWTKKHTSAPVRVLGLVDVQQDVYDQDSALSTDGGPKKPSDFDVKLFPFDPPSIPEGCWGFSTTEVVLRALQGDSRKSTGKQQPSSFGASWEHREAGEAPSTVTDAGFHPFSWWIAIRVGNLTTAIREYQAIQCLCYSTFVPLFVPQDILPGHQPAEYGSDAKRFESDHEARTYEMLVGEGSGDGIVGAASHQRVTDGGDTALGPDLDIPGLSRDFRSIITNEFNASQARAIMVAASMDAISSYKDSLNMRDGKASVGGSSELSLHSSFRNFLPFVHTTRYWREYIAPPRSHSLRVGAPISAPGASLGGVAHGQFLTSGKTGGSLSSLSLGTTPALVSASYTSLSQAAQEELNACGPSLLLLQGPPGTGKTATLLGIVSALLVLRGVSVRRWSSTEPAEVAATEPAAPARREPLESSAIPAETGEASTEPSTAANAARKKVAASAFASNLFARKKPRQGKKSEAAKPPKSKAPASSSTSVPKPASSSRLQSSGLKWPILICTPSNAAIDEIVVRLMQKGIWAADGKMTKPKVIRVGSRPSNNSLVMAASLDQQVKDQLSKVQAQYDTQISFAESKIATLTRKLAEVHRSGKPEEIRRIKTELSVSKRNRYSLTSEISTKRAEARAKLLNEADIICCTMSSAASKDLSSCLWFEAVVIDEGGQATEPTALIPLRHHTRKLVIIGDPMQLPPTVLSRASEGLLYGRSLLERLMRSGKEALLLQTQYRMLPPIRSFASSSFYRSQLTDAVSVSKRWRRLLKQEKEPSEFVPYWKQHSPGEFAFSPFMFYDVPLGVEQRTGHSLENPQEAKLVVALVSVLVLQYGRKVLEDGVVGIVTPYRRQVQLIRRMLQSEHGFQAAGLVSTVDSFQGQERPLIIFSAVRSQRRRNVHAEHYGERYRGRTGAASGAGEPEDVVPGDVADWHAGSKQSFNPYNLRPITKHEWDTTVNDPVTSLLEFLNHGSPIGFLSDVRRLNVTVTRARNSLVLIGNGHWLSKHDPNWRNLVGYASAIDCLVATNLPSEVATATDEPGVNFQNFVRFRHSDHLKAIKGTPVPRNPMAPLPCLSSEVARALSSPWMWSDVSVPAYRGPTHSRFSHATRAFDEHQPPSSASAPRATDYPESDRRHSRSRERSSDRYSRRDIPSPSPYRRDQPSPRHHSPVPGAASGRPQPQQQPPPPQQQQQYWIVPPSHPLNAMSGTQPPRPPRPYPQGPFPFNAHPNYGFRNANAPRHFPSPRPAQLPHRRDAGPRGHGGTGGFHSGRGNWRGRGRGRGGFASQRPPGPTAFGGSIAALNLRPPR